MMSNVMTMKISSILYYAASGEISQATAMVYRLLTHKDFKLYYTSSTNLYHHLYLPLLTFPFVTNM